MESHIVKIRSKHFLNHNVVQLVTTKPEKYHYTPGQATDVALCSDGWQDEPRPFTFTSLPNEDHLQFTIKIYPSHNGVTKQIAQLEVGDRLTVAEPYGAIAYKGQGVFVAGGAGITPFLAILKDLQHNKRLEGNTLIFSNKTQADIFLESPLRTMLGTNFINTLSQEKSQNYLDGQVDAALLKSEVSDFSQFFYVCGPPKMIESVKDDLKSLGVEEEKIVTENFDD